MTEAEREHIKVMVDHALRVQRDQAGKVTSALTPDELAEALKMLKAKYPDDFPKHDN
jgi:hypothetical protein